MIIRRAEHAGSWYTSSKCDLEEQIDQALAAVPQKYHNVPGCRLIIAPHAGYSYSLRTAAYAYEAIDTTHIKRIFLLGPSHHVGFQCCAISECTACETPLGNILIDTEMIKKLRKSQMFTLMSKDVDENEHSLEMHLPLIHRRFKHNKYFPKLVPILVGALSEELETEYGKILSEYLADKQNVFIISSDFAHWGHRFEYQFYRNAEHPDGINLTRYSKKSEYSSRHIYESIEDVNREGMRLISSGNPHDFGVYLKKTGNTVCGRHPIGVAISALHALEQLERPIVAHKNKFSWIHESESNKVRDPRDSSVSYAAGIMNCI